MSWERVCSFVGPEVHLRLVSSCISPSGALGISERGFPGPSSVLLRTVARWNSKIRVAGSEFGV
jgi:hypothetical protein